VKIFSDPVFPYDVLWYQSKYSFLGCQLTWRESEVSNTERYPVVNPSLLSITKNQSQVLNGEGVVK
jgi:hypothetical protein